MTDKEIEFRTYITEKLKDEAVSMMVYACHSFGKQRDGFRKLMIECHKKFPEVYDKLPWTSYLVCGWADDLTRMYGRVFPDFKERFGKGISVGRIMEITNEVMFGG